MPTTLAVSRTFNFLLPGTRSWSLLMIPGVVASKGFPKRQRDLCSDHSDNVEITYLLLLSV